MASGYKITVEGQYYCSVPMGKGRGLARYSFEVNLPTMDQALAVIKNKILDKVLSKKYKDYVSYRTFNIVNVQPFGDATKVNLDIWQMNRPLLLEHIRKNSLPVNTDLFPVLLDLRNAVDLVKADLDRFISFQKKVEKEFALNNSLKDLNPELYGYDAPVWDNKTDDKNIVDDL